MEMVACPACGQANRLPVGLEPTQACCAACEAMLESEPPPRYYIAQDQDVQGPFERDSVLQWIRQGKVRAEMMFCEEGGDWVPGRACPDLFPDAAPVATQIPGRAAAHAYAPEPIHEVPAETAPVPRALRHDVEHAQHAHHTPPAPGVVVFAAILDFILTCVYVWFVVQVLQAMGTVSQEADAVSLRTALILQALVGALFGVAYVVLGVALLRGSAGGRIAQYVLCGVSVLVSMYALSRGSQDQKLTAGVTIGLAVLVVVLISMTAATEFFNSASRRGGHRRRPYRRRRRRY